MSRFFPTTTSVAQTAVGLLLAGSAMVGCGHPPPDDPVESPGVVAGTYLLEIVPAPACGSGAATFNVMVTQTGDHPHPGVQLLNGATDDAVLELELQYSGSVLAGAFGALPSDGVASLEGHRVWVNAIGEGKTTRSPDGRGEVTVGTLRGFFEIEALTISCMAHNHTFSLRATQ